MKLFVLLIKDVVKDFFGLFSWDNLKILLQILLFSVVTIAIFFLIGIGIGYIVYLVWPQLFSPKITIGDLFIVGMYVSGFSLIIYYCGWCAFKYLKTKVNKISRLTDGKDGR